MTLTEYAKQSDKYAHYTFLAAPAKFSKIFEDKRFDAVQIMSIIENNGRYIDEDSEFVDVGFCGSFSWKNNTLRPLDYDSYYPDMLIYGYEQWTKENKNGLSIIVGEDW